MRCGIVWIRGSGWSGVFNMLLVIENLSVRLCAGEKQTAIVEGVNLRVPDEKIVALVGGSGSGMTTTGLAVMRLLAPELAVTAGKIIFQGKDLLSLSETRMRHVRGKSIGMVFQEPLYAFNPVFTIGYQIEEVLRMHTTLNSSERKGRVRHLLETVEIGEPGRVAHSYPHQLSGGMRQRAMIAQAIAGNPQLIIADEPTSNLDVTLQARIMELFRRLTRELKLSIILITHDLGLVGHLADEVTVMEQGKSVEWGKTKEVLARPQQEYTQRLMKVLKD